MWTMRDVPTGTTAAAQLQEWLATTGTSGAALARTVGVSRMSVWAWRVGITRPSLASALRVHTATGIAVEDWLLAPP